MKYPETSTEDVWDELAGVRTTDPYRWLEDGASEEVQLWQKQQNELTSGYVRSWPGFGRMRELVEAHSTARFGPVPRAAGGRWFRSVVRDGASQACVVVADSPVGEGSVLFDPDAIEGESPPYLSWHSPSPDGRLLAIGLCADGSEQNTITLIDVETGGVRPAPPGRLMDALSGGVSWLPDSSGFYVTVIDGAAIDLAQRVLLFDVASGATTEVAVPWLDDRDYRVIQPSWDGTRLVAYQGLMRALPVAVAELDDPAAPSWRPFVSGTDAVLHGHLVGNRYLAVTDLDAPRGRVVSISLDDPTDWITVVPESDAVIRTLTPVGDVLYLTELVDTYARVRVVTPDGQVLQEVALPSKGTVAEHPFPFANLAPKGARDAFLFSFSSLTASWGVYQHVPGSPDVVELEPPAVRLDAIVEDCWATSPDGTLVPYHVVRAPDVTSAPTLLWAYGGYNVPWVPQFPGAMAALVAAGGIFVHAHLRGGGELGREWWEGGRLKNKQNCYADLYAVAEDLIARGVATPTTLAVSGGSNGGLLSGVAVTQRPDLWGAVVPRVPLLDVIGACRENYGRFAVSCELGDVEDPEEVRRLLTFSPYHLVEDRDYPAVFLDAGDTDPRCPPWHVRKLGARLQAAQQGEAPVLVRIWPNVGHGAATDKQVAIEQSADWLSFICKELGL